MLTLKADAKDRIRKARLARDMTMKDVAARMGVAQPTVQRWESGNIKLTQAIIEKLADIYEMHPAYLSGWIDEETPEDNKCIIPVLGRIPAGMPTTAIEFREGSIEVPKAIVNRFGRSNLFALKIKGDSMNKVVPDGAVGIFYKTEDVDNKALVAVSVNGDDATLKRIEKLNGYVILKPESYNPDHTIHTYDATTNRGFKVIGQLIACIQMFI